MLKFVAISFLGLSFGCARVVEMKVNLKPETPEVKVQALAPSIYLEDFSDARKGYDSGPMLACWDAGGRTFMPCVNDDKPRWHIIMADGKEPKDLMRSQVKSLLQRAGYTVHEGEGGPKPGMPSMAGRIKSINMEARASFGTTALRAEFQLELSVDRLGKRQLSTVLHGSKERKTSNNMSPTPYETVAKEAIEAVMDEAVEMLESKAMAVALGLVNNGEESNSIGTDLEKLIRLKKSGDLTESEFKKAKAKLLEGK